MSEKKWMIYGATGYSGGLLAEAAVAAGHRPVLAGRSAARLQPLADRLGLEARAVGLDDAAALQAALADVALVIHCAGPFSATSAPMIEACLASGTHYFDITGEISVYEHAHAQDARAREAGVIVCPGVGFDVIPTDCIALTLAEALPDATHLALAFAGAFSMSPGTAKTSVEAMGEKTRVRENGQIVGKPNGFTVRHIDYGKGPRQSTPISWGDVASAHYSTGIPNIEVYIPASDRTLRSMRLGNYFRFLLRTGPVQNFLKGRIEKSVRGPSADKRKAQRTLVWGEARNAAGAVKVARVETPNGYDVTITGPLAIVDHVLGSAELPAGYLTPAMLMGADFIARLPDTSAIEVTDG